MKMAKDLKGKELGTGLRQRKDGRYEARAKVNGIDICLYNLNLKDLKKDFEEAKEKALQNIDTKKGTITLTEWFDEWFDKYKTPSIKATSVFPMKSKFYCTFGRLLGDMKIEDIRNMDIQEAINTLHSEGRATSSMRDALGRIRECMESAKNNRLITLNPCFEITVPWEETGTKERRFLSIEEQEIFLKEVEHTWYKEMFNIILNTGMRIGEVGGLKWCDVDFKNKCINVNRSLHCSYEKGVKRMVMTSPKTQNSYRKIPFMGNTEEMLLSQKKKQDAIKKELGNRYRSDGDFSDLVFTTTMGSPILRYHAEKECKKAIKAINLQEAYLSVKEKRPPVIMEDIYPHALRHTFCSRCFEAEMNPKVVQALMGHATYSTTIDIYTHVTDAKFDSEIEKFDSKQNEAVPKAI